MVPGEEIKISDLDSLIENHMAFIIRIVSDFTGRYVSIENDEEFSIALNAFAEAVERYDKEKGSFLSYSKLVILSRLKNNLRSKEKRLQEISLDSLMESGNDFSKEEYNKQYSPYHEEILLYREELLKFGITLEMLAAKGPKHKDTKEKAIYIGEKASEDSEIVDYTYAKKRLPVKKVARYTKTTEKIVKGSKNFILAVMIVFVKKYPSLSKWLRKAGEKHVS